MDDIVRSEAARLATAAWIMVGTTRNMPGVLVHDGERVAFIGADGIVFDVAATEVRDVRFPWFYFGGGCTLRAGDQVVRLSFVRPNGARDLTETDLAAMRRFRLEHLGVAGDLFKVAGSLADIGKGRESARAWRAALVEG